MSRFLICFFTLGLTLGNSVDRKDWITGEIVATLHIGKAYEYKILAVRDRYTGRSTRELHLRIGDHVKFAALGKKIYVIGEDGKTQTLQYRLQELLPPPPPPPIKW